MLSDAVTDVLVERMRDPRGLRPMVAASAAIHLGLIVFLLLMPEEWRRSSVEPTTVMTISLGGAPGPRNGGMTPMGGQPVQQVQEQPPARPEAIRSPAARTPEMTMPAEKSRPQPKESPKRGAAAEARGRKPTTGPELQEGSAVAQTGGRGQGFGLTSGGGGTGAYLDVGDFCCPEYLTTMLQLIERNWSAKQTIAGETLMLFRIERNGTITNVQVERSSGYSALDFTAQRALVLTRQLPPLPAEFPNPNLTVHLRFQYQR